MGVVSNLATGPADVVGSGAIPIPWFAYGPGVGGWADPPLGYMGSIKPSAGGFRSIAARCLLNLPIIPSFVNGLANTSLIPGQMLALLTPLECPRGCARNLPHWKYISRSCWLIFDVMAIIGVLGCMSRIMAVAETPSSWGMTISMKIRS